jgi:hypothetical protein
MSEKQKNDLRGQIDAEKSLLDTIQTVNSYAMDEPLGDEYESIADKVRGKYSIEPGKAADLALSVGKVTDHNGNEVAERIWVQVATKDSKNPNQTNYYHTPAVTVFEGAVLPEDGFVTEEAMALSGMVEGLKEAKKIGALTHISPDFSRINDPSTMLMQLPPLQPYTQK